MYLKANEVMADDYVQIINPETFENLFIGVVKGITIDPSSKIYVQNPDDKSIQPYPETWVIPIKLTKQIIDQIVDKPYVPITIGSYSFISDNHRVMKIEISNGNCIVFGQLIFYVHELQHAIKFKGIEKEINLKINHEMLY